MSNGLLTDVKLWLARLVGRTVPADQAGEFVERLVHDKTHYTGPERRTFHRHPLVVPVSAIPLDENFQPAGSLFRAVTRNISGSGISVFSQTRCHAKFLSLLLVNSASDYLEVVVQVARYGMVGPLFEYAGPFVAVPERAKFKNRCPATLGQRASSARDAAAHAPQPQPLGELDATLAAAPSPEPAVAASS